MLTTQRAIDWRSPQAFSAASDVDVHVYVDGKEVGGVNPTPCTAVHVTSTVLARIDVCGPHLRLRAATVGARPERVTVRYRLLIPGAGPRR